MDNWNIYILRLERGKYYIGKTRNLSERIEQHLLKQGSEWTFLHPVIDIEKIIDNQTSFDEDKYVKIYMKKYGINNVRGGSYSQVKLTISQTENLHREIYGAEDCCFRCGKKGHFVGECYLKGDEEDEDEDEEDEEDKERLRKSKILCYRCGRRGHYSNECYAVYHTNGRLL